MVQLPQRDPEGMAIPSRCIILPLLNPDGIFHAGTYAKLYPVWDANARAILAGQECGMSSKIVQRVSCDNLK